MSRVETTYNIMRLTKKNIQNFSQMFHIKVVKIRVHINDYINA